VVCPRVSGVYKGCEMCVMFCGDFLVSPGTYMHMSLTVYLSGQSARLEAVVRIILPSLVILCPLVGGDIFKNMVERLVLLGVGLR